MTTNPEKFSDSTNDTAGAVLNAEDRIKIVQNSASAEQAAELLTAPTALLQLSRDDARVVVSYMTPRRFEAGTRFIKEGDTDDTGFMVLVLAGEVTVESISVSRTEPVTVSVLGPGSLVGEMGLLGNEPRSASCTASTNVRCAVLTRVALEFMIDQNPRIGAQLLLAVSTRLSERLRSTARQLKLYAKLARAMQQEIDQLTK
jgi:CRP/FNR family transcriptional regulator, cyclic AMP receptor protein